MDSWPCYGHLVAFAVLKQLELDYWISLEETFTLLGWTKSSLAGVGGQT